MANHTSKTKRYVGTCLRYKLMYVVAIVFIIIVALDFYTSHINSTKVISPDKNGCPMINYGYQGGYYIGTVYSPLKLSQFILDQYDSYVTTGDRRYRDTMLRCVDVLLSIAEDRGDFIVFTYDFPWPYYNISGKWASSMSQIDGVLALYKSYEVTGNSTYLHLAGKALNAFFVDTDRGGLTHFTEYGPWYEEYAYPNITGPYVLNGFMYTLIKLYEYYNASKDERAKSLFLDGLRTLKATAHMFDTGDWTTYDLIGTLSPWAKHQLHIKFSRELYHITNDEFFLDLSNRWADYNLRLTGLYLGAKYYIGLTLRQYMLLPLPAKYSLLAPLLYILFKRCISKNRPLSRTPM